MTVTEIEVYDTERPADPTTGERPVKARIRQTHGEESRTNAKQEAAAESKAESKAETAETIDGGTLTEATVTATKAPSLWERLKQGSAWGTAILILAAAGWIIYKFKKRKTT